MNYRLISLFHSLLDDLITGCRYKNAHKRADDIKDAIREISPSRYAKDCRLRHAASGPWVYSRRLFFVMDSPNKFFIRTFLVLSIVFNFAAKIKKDLGREVTYGSK